MAILAPNLDLGLGVFPGKTRVLHDGAQSSGRRVPVHHRVPGHAQHACGGLHGAQPGEEQQLVLAGRAHHPGAFRAGDHALAEPTVGGVCLKNVKI